MPIHLYRRTSDDDARALVAYLRAQPPVKNAVPKSVYYMKLPRAYGRPIKEKVVAPPRTARSSTARIWPGRSAIASIATRRTPTKAWT